VIVLLLSILYSHRGASSSAVRRELEKSSATAPLPAKAAAQAAAADAKAKVVPSVTPAAGTESSPAQTAGAGNSASSPAATAGPATPAVSGHASPLRYWLGKTAVGNNGRWL